MSHQKLGYILSYMRFLGSQVPTVVDGRIAAATETSACPVYKACTSKVLKSKRLLINSSINIESTNEPF